MNGIAIVLLLACKHQKLILHGNPVRRVWQPLPQLRHACPLDHAATPAAHRTGKLHRQSLTAAVPCPVALLPGRSFYGNQ